MVDNSKNLYLQLNPEHRNDDKVVVVIHQRAVEVDRGDGVGGFNLNINRQRIEINRHSGENRFVSFNANLVALTVLKNPINLKSPIALNKKSSPIAKIPYRK